MTISTSRTAERTVDSIVVDSYALAGLGVIAAGQPMYQGRILQGRRFLTDILDELQASGVTTKFGYTYFQTLEADEENYTLPSYALSVLGDGRYISASETDVTRPSSEKLVKQISLSEYQQMGNRDNTGDPTRFFADNSGTAIVVKVWPIPDEAGTIRFVVHRAIADADAGLTTIELRPYWYEYLEHRLAYKFARVNGLPQPVISGLRDEAARLKTTARGASNSHVQGMMRLHHPTPWSN